MTKSNFLLEGQGRATLPWLLSLFYDKIFWYKVFSTRLLHGRRYFKHPMDSKNAIVICGISRYRNFIRDNANSHLYILLRWYLIVITRLILKLNISAHINKLCSKSHFIKIKENTSCFDIDMILGWEYNVPLRCTL